MKLELVNLTPHAITAAGQTIAPSGRIARVSVTRHPAGNVNGIPLFRPKFGAVEGLPAPDAGKLHIVSALVRTHPDVAGRRDVASPGALTRDETGAITGCDGFDVNPL